MATKTPTQKETVIAICAELGRAAALACQPRDPKENAQMTAIKYSLPHHAGTAGRAYCRAWDAAQV